MVKRINCPLVPQLVLAPRVLRGPSGNPGQIQIVSRGTPELNLPTPCNSLAAHTSASCHCLSGLPGLHPPPGPDSDPPPQRRTRPPATFSALTLDSGWRQLACHRRPRMSIRTLLPLPPAPVPARPPPEHQSSGLRDALMLVPTLPSLPPIQSLAPPPTVSLSLPSSPYLKGISHDCN